MKIQFLMFDGCPLADAARVALREALDDLGLLDFEEVDLLARDTPEEMRVWGSPTILVNGLDVWGEEAGDGIGCRIYPTDEQIPSVASIVAGIKTIAEGKH